MHSVLTYAVIQWAYPIICKETYEQEYNMKAHELMNFNDQIADMDLIVTILQSEEHYELADDVIKASKGFEELVQEATLSSGK